jgi:hypothetical protein
MDSERIKEGLAFFFDWNSPSWKPAVDTTKSKSSGPPLLYDKHLEEKLILMEIQMLPFLCQNIANHDACGITSPH